MGIAFIRFTIFNLYRALFWSQESGKAEKVLLTNHTEAMLSEIYFLSTESIDGTLVF